jgi:hypothetical protein
MQPLVDATGCMGSAAAHARGSERVVRPVNPGASCLHRAGLSACHASSGAFTQHGRRDAAVCDSWQWLVACGWLEASRCAGPGSPWQHGDGAASRGHDGCSGWPESCPSQRCGAACGEQHAHHAVWSAHSATMNRAAVLSAIPDTRLCDGLFTANISPYTKAERALREEYSL